MHGFQIRVQIEYGELRWFGKTALPVTTCSQDKQSWRVYMNCTLLGAQNIFFYNRQVFLVNKEPHVKHCNSLGGFVSTHWPSREMFSVLQVRWTVGKKEKWKWGRFFEILSTRFFECLDKRTLFLIGKESNMHRWCFQNSSYLSRIQTCKRLTSCPSTSL